MPLADARGQLSWARLTTPEMSRNARGQVSWALLTTPAPTPPDNNRGQISYVSLTAPAQTSLSEARGQLSWAQLTTPAGQTAPPASGSLIYNVDFETGDLSQVCANCIHQGVDNLDAWGPSRIRVVAEGEAVYGVYGGSPYDQGPWYAPAPRMGRYTCSFVVDGPSTQDGTASAGTQRAELSTSYLADGVTKNVMRPGQEVYVGFSLYIPSVPNGANTGNFGPMTDAGGFWTTGYGLGYPEGEFQFETGNPLHGAYGIPDPVWYTSIGRQYHGDIIACNTSPGPTASNDCIFDVPVVEDQWIDFTYYSKFNTFTGNTENQDGVVTIWVNGVQKWTISNYINLPYQPYQDEISPYRYFEFAWYRACQDYPNLMYIDHIKMGDTYDIVQP